VLFAPATAALLAGCARTEATRYELLVRTDSDPGHPLAGARVSFEGETVGVTGDAGTLGVVVRGSEGEHVALGVVCPDGYASPVASIPVVLHRLAESGRRPEYDIQCPPVSRSIVVVVRADRGAGLPLMYLGKEVARTDESGAAHALITAPASEDVEVLLSTNETGHERLRPQNPSMKFLSTDRSDIRFFDFQFQLAPERAHASAARPAMPVRLH
jgi:hypothetical protein